MNSIPLLVMKWEALKKRKKNCQPWPAIFTESLAFNISVTMQDINVIFLFCFKEHQQRNALVTSRNSSFFIIYGDRGVYINCNKGRGTTAPSISMNEKEIYVFFSFLLKLFLVFIFWYNTM